MGFPLIFYSSVFCKIHLFTFQSEEAVFHLAISNMAQRHVAFCEHHVVLREHHGALHERHVALLKFSW